MNLVLHFCHLAFVLLRHPLVEIIQYHLAMLQVECLRLRKILPYLRMMLKFSFLNVHKLLRLAVLVPAPKLSLNAWCPGTGRQHY